MISNYSIYVRCKLYSFLNLNLITNVTEEIKNDNFGNDNVDTLNIIKLKVEKIAKEIKKKRSHEPI